MKSAPQARTPATAIRVSAQLVSPTGSGFRRRGFTLVELLVVIGIILILMGLLFPVIRSVMEAGRKTEAKHTVHQIVVAANAYYTDHSQWPNVATSSAATRPEEDQWVGDPAMRAKIHNNAFFFTLRAIPKGTNADHRANPSRVEYFGTKAAKFSNGKPRNGFFDRDENSQAPPANVEGCFYDPWGAEYGVILDTNGDNLLDAGAFYGDYSTDFRPRKKAGAFSTGKDGTLGTRDDQRYRKSGEASDDVVSWD